MDERDAMWHKRVAVELYNRCWDLMNVTARSPDDGDEMLRTAFTSRHHWGIVGGPTEVAIGDWQIARALSLLAHGDLAIVYAERALTRVRATEGMPDFMLASALEGVARAHDARGDVQARDLALADARAALDTIADAEDRAEIERQINSVPGA